jgi:hypothetical protein
MAPQIEQQPTAPPALHPCSFGTVDDVVTFPGRMYAFVNYRATSEAVAAFASLQDQHLPELTGEPQAKASRCCSVSPGCHSAPAPASGVRLCVAHLTHLGRPVCLSALLCVTPQRPAFPSALTLVGSPVVYRSSCRRAPPADQVPPRQEGGRAPACAGAGGRRRHAGRRQVGPPTSQHSGACCCSKSCESCVLKLDDVGDTSGCG